MLLNSEPVQNAPKRCMRESWDADEHAHNLTDWSQEYDQFSGGAFYGRIDEIQLGGMQVFKEYTSHSVWQQCNVWPDSLWLGIPVYRQGCRIDGRPVGDDEVMCQPGAHDFELVTPDDFAIYGLVIDKRLLGGLAGAEVLDMLHASPEVLSRLVLSQHTRKAVTFLIEHLLARPREHLSIAVHQEILLLALLEIVHEERPNTQVTPSYQHRRQVVDCIREHLQVCQAPPVTLMELCKIANVSQRTLQYSFTSILGISPSRFLRMTRLNRVRRRLAAADGRTTVTEVASDWGFYHLGQFAQDYRQLFGESPSDTLARCRNSVR